MTKNKSKSILNYIIVTFFVFTTIAILVGILFIWLSTTIISNITSRPTDEEISDIVDKIIESNFAEEKFEILIDKDVILEVYDKNLNLVYSFGHALDETCNAITKEELAIIPFYDSTSTVSVEYGVFSDGQNVITVTTFDQKDGKESILSMYIFDNEYNVIYSMPRSQ